MAGSRSVKDRTGSTNMSVLLVALFAVLIAIGLLWLAEQSGDLALNATWKAIVNNVGGLVLATALIALAWELAGKRSFADEILAKANLSADVTRAGIIRVTDQYLEDVAWGDLIEGSSKIDIVVAYANTWRNAQWHRLKKVAARKEARIRVFLPDPDDPLTMKVLAERFSVPTDEVQRRVQAAIDGFRSLRQPNGADVEVHVRPGDAVFSCYRFDGRAVLTMYSHSKQRRTSVPTFVVGGGDLWSFVYEETQEILDQSRQIFPKAGDSNDVTS